jgi:hypothetical protein
MRKVGRTEMAMELRETIVDGEHGRGARLHERTNNRLQQQKVALLLGNSYPPSPILRVKPHNIEKHNRSIIKNAKSVVMSHAT